MASKASRARPRGATPAPRREQLLAWVERVAMLFHNDSGLPPITGRIFGWLMVCDPPEQSGAEIAEAIGASRASITTNVRVLTAAGLVRRSTRPGERTAYYVVDEDAWEQLVRRRNAALASLAEITADGIELLGCSGERASRVRSAHEVLTWFADLLANASPIPRSERSRR
jgi:DNA-binding MarR family transcriptional regulator